MVGGGPQRARREIEVAVAADGDRQPPMLLVGERSAKRGRQRVADAAAARTAVPAMRLVEVPELARPIVAGRGADQRPILVLDLVVDLHAHAGNRDRARIPAHGRIRAHPLQRRQPQPRKLLAARLVGRFAAVVEEPLHRFGERRQRRLAVAGDGEVEILVAREVLIVGLEVEIAGPERDDLGTLLGRRPRGAHDAVGEGIRRGPDIVRLEAENNVGLSERRPAGALVERMARREVHAAAIVEHRALQGLGQLHQPRHAGGRARQPVADQHRAFGRDQHFRQFGDRARIRLRRHHLGELGNAQALRVGDRVLLQLGIEREENRRHRRRGRDLVGAHGRFREMLERGRLVVPFDELAHERRRIEGRMHPFGAGRALVGFQDVADHDVDRHAIAPGIVERHRGVLQADHAVAHHGHRLAFHLGVAVRHGDGDLLMGAGEDLGLGIVAVIDHGLLDAAEARGAIDGAVIHVERLEHVHHEVAAARGLRHRILRRRERLGRDLLRAGRGGLEIGPRRGDLRLGGGRRQRRGADQARALEEIATRNIWGISAFRHGRPPRGCVRFRGGIGAKLVCPPS